MRPARVQVIDAGSVRVDGGALFGRTPRITWETWAMPDRQHRVQIGLNCLLIQTDDRSVLVDMGMGNHLPPGEMAEHGAAPSRLVRSLRDAGADVDRLGRPAVDVVVLTHLHRAHAGGALRMDRQGHVGLMLAGIPHVVQGAALADAQRRGEPGHELYEPGLVEALGPCLEPVHGEAEVAPGVTVVPTGGHCAGHQAVRVDAGGERWCFPGDLIPTAWHVDPACASAMDDAARETLEAKRRLLDQAEAEGWRLVFAHGLTIKAGYIERRHGVRTVRPVAV